MGIWTGLLQSVELYNPATKTSCTLPKLPEARKDHTQDGELACGGQGGIYNTTRTCVKWSSDSGSWTQSHTLGQIRYGHDESWNTEDGVYLMGGAYYHRTCKLVKADGSVEDGFSLKYYTA